MQIKKKIITGKMYYSIYNKSMFCIYNKTHGITFPHAVEQRGFSSKSINDNK